MRCTNKSLTDEVGTAHTKAKCAGQKSDHIFRDIYLFFVLFYVSYAIAIFSVCGPVFALLETEQHAIVVLGHLSIKSDVIESRFQSEKVEME